MKKRKLLSKRVATILLVAALLAGLSVLLYPSVSNLWNSRTMSRTVSSYSDTVHTSFEEDYEEIFEAARDYNERLCALGSAQALANPDLVEGYDEILDITGTGIMGYLTIDRLDLALPIYHGTDAGVLAAGAGHLEGSSLPIGGESTHSVISAHRGLPSAQLFSHLDRMEVGDTFRITVLNQTCTYVVDKISIVLPTEFEELYIEPGEDYCTLMTCTPYGINTHRLLVRGVRTDNVIPIETESAANKVNWVLAASVTAVTLVAILLVLVRKKRKKKLRNTG